MGWHWVASVTPGQQDASFFPPLKFFSMSFCSVIFVAKEGSSEVLVELKISLFEISSIFFSAHIINLIVIAKNMK